MEVAVYGHSRYDHSVYGGRDSEFPFEEIKEFLFPTFEQMNPRSQKRAIRDAMHLATHRMYKRDIFVTLDEKHIIARTRGLKEKFGIIVLSPEETLKKIVAGH